MRRASLRQTVIMCRPEQVPATPEAAWAAFEELRRENRKVVDAFDVSTLLPRADEALPV